MPRISLTATLAGAAFVGAALSSVGLAHLATSTPPRPASLKAAAAPRIFLTPAESDELAGAGLLPKAALSVLNVPRTLRHGDFVWNEQGVPPGRLEVRVDPARQLISVFRARHEIGTAIVTFGASSNETPSGVLHVIAKFREHRSSTYDADMPYTLRLTQDGVSIHASDVRWGAATHGCIGVPEEFARRLFDQVHVGQAVTILSSSQPG